MPTFNVGTLAACVSGGVIVAGGCLPYTGCHGQNNGNEKIIGTCQRVGYYFEEHSTCWFRLPHNLLQPRGSGWMTTMSESDCQSAIKKSIAAAVSKLDEEIKHLEEKTAKEITPTPCRCHWPRGLDFQL